MGLEVILTGRPPDAGGAELARGSDAINITSETVMGEEALAACAQAGVRLVACRTAGYEHVDLEAARRLGLGVTRISYSPSAVADYAIMLMLMVTRHVKTLMARSLGQDYSLSAVRGRELPDLTVGILGTGRIGETVARHLSGFGCRLLAWSPHPKEALRGLVRYCSPEELLSESDVVTLHMRAAEDTRHWLDRARLGQMKPGAVLINTARGSLVDSSALIDAIESGRLAGAGLDVVDGDRPVFYRDHKNQVVAHRELAVLQSFPNVLVLPHMAFYTDHAVEDMVRRSLEAAVEYLTRGSSPWQAE